MDFTTCLYKFEDGVSTITLNRPDRLNSFTQVMCDEFAAFWAHARVNDEIRVVVIRAAGDRAFSSGADVEDALPMAFRPNVWSQEDPGAALSPKVNQCWKPVVCAVHGIAAAGAFYWINESDIVICSEDAMFFDPHVSYGLAAALEPIGLAQRIPLGEVLRIALLGLDERMSAQRALQIGLVSEITTREELWGRAEELARIIAAKPPTAVQGTVRAIWEAQDLGRAQALQHGMTYTQIGNPISRHQVERSAVARRKWTLR